MLMKWMKSHTWVEPDCAQNDSHRKLWRHPSQNCFLKCQNIFIAYPKFKRKRTKNMFYGLWYKPTFSENGSIPFSAAVILHDLVQIMLGQIFKHTKSPSAHLNFCMCAGSHFLCMFLTSSLLETLQISIRNPDCIGLKYLYISYPCCLWIAGLQL